MYVKQSFLNGKLLMMKGIKQKKQPPYSQTQKQKKMYMAGCFLHN